MSYKVLRDGNGSSLIRVIGLGDYMPLKDHQAMVTECEEKSKAIFDIMAERDAFAAQVYRMSEFIRLSAKKWEGVPEVEPTFWNLLRVANESPQQCLAEIKAEAVKDFVMFLPSYAYNINDELEKEASKYAAKIRNTGTWLKDSNVNGGKRGGEK